MKTFLAFVLFVGVASAAYSPERRAVHRAVAHIHEGFENAGKLSDHLNLPEYNRDLHNIERRMKTKLGEFLRDALDDLVNGITNRIKDVKDVSNMLKNKVQELRQKLRELEEGAGAKSKEAIEVVKKKIHEMVESIRESLKNHEANLDQELDAAAKLKVRDLINQIRKRISDKVQNIRDYMKEVAVDNKVVKELQKVLDQLNDSELKAILNNVTDLSSHEVQHLKGLYNKLKELAGKTNSVLNDKINDLLGYVQGLWKNGIQNLVDEFKRVRSSLMEVISNTKDLSVEAAKDALDHISAYKDELGDLYHRLVDTLKKAIGRF